MSCPLHPLLVRLALAQNTVEQAEGWVSDGIARGDAAPFLGYLHSVLGYAKSRLEVASTAWEEAGRPVEAE